jgi:catechol 2,3-dioxygenase-like lactoylglutathione lyase family enzyme
LRYANAAVGAEVQVLRRRDVPLRISLRFFTTGGREPFSELRVGMDHFALGVADDSALAAWQARLEDAGINCSHTDLPELLILVFRDPDNIQIELSTPLRPGTRDV